MMRHKFTWFFSSLAIFSSAAQAFATTVNVQMEDFTSASTVHGMHMVADKISVPTGPVTFNITNRSKSLVHEMIVMKTSKPISAFPYNKITGRAIESKMHSMGEVSETKPGGKGTLTVSLKPGAYVLMCNQPQHLKMGMWEKFTVTK